MVSLRYGDVSPIDHRYGSLPTLKVALRSRSTPPTINYISDLFLGYGRGPVHVVTDHGQFIIAVLFSEGHVRLPDLFILRDQRLKAFGSHSNKDLAAILPVTDTLDKP